MMQELTRGVESDALDVELRTRVGLTTFVRELDELRERTENPEARAPVPEEELQAIGLVLACLAEQQEVGLSEVMLRSASGGQIRSWRTGVRTEDGLRVHLRSDGSFCTAHAPVDWPERIAKGAILLGGLGGLASTFWAVIPQDDIWQILLLAFLCGFLGLLIGGIVGFLAGSVADCFMTSRIRLAEASPRLSSAKTHELAAWMSKTVEETLQELRSEHAELRRQIEEREHATPPAYLAGVRSSLEQAERRLREEDEVAAPSGE